MEVWETSSIIYNLRHERELWDLLLQNKPPHQLFFPCYKRLVHTQLLTCHSLTHSLLVGPARVAQRLESCAHPLQPPLSHVEGGRAAFLSSPGTCGVLLRKVNGTAIIQLPSKRQMQVCVGTGGRDQQRRNFLNAPLLSGEQLAGVLWC